MNHLFQSHLAKLITELNNTHHWELNETQYHKYIVALLAYADANVTDENLKRLITCYHENHWQVEILREHTHPHHQTLWYQWLEQDIGRILHHRGLHWSQDQAVDIEDLKQEALQALVKALPTYAYQSRFSTWAHSVIVHSVQNYLRRFHAEKRAINPESLDKEPGDSHTETGNIAQTPSIEAETRGKVLGNLINTILQEQNDERYQDIFWMRFYGYKLKEIGEVVQLSESRVNVLLKQIVALLREHPAIKEWGR